MKTLTPIFAFLLLAGIIACRTGSKPDALFLSDWAFIGFKTVSNPVLDHVPASLPGMNISFSRQGKFKARSSCNTLYGNFLVSDKNSIKIDSISMTKMFCIDSLEMSWEDNYVTALRHATNIKINHDTLVLSTDLMKDILFLSVPRKTN